MPKFQGVDIKPVSQFDAYYLPEFRPKQNDDPFCNEGPVLHSDKTVSVYIPAFPGSRFWFEYSVDGPHPNKMIYYFKMTYNNKLITSWDTTSKVDFKGKTMLGLRHLGTDPFTGGDVIQRDIFTFANFQEIPTNPFDDCIQITVHRVEKRQRMTLDLNILNKKPQPPVKKPQDFVQMPKQPTKKTSFEEWKKSVGAKESPKKPSPVNTSAATQVANGISAWNNFHNVAVAQDKAAHERFKAEQAAGVKAPIPQYEIEETFRKVELNDDGDRKVTTVTVDKPATTNVVLANGGLVESRPARFYKYQLLDPLDKPMATFRFFFRSIEQLRALGVQGAGRPLSSSPSFSSSSSGGASLPPPAPAPPTVETLSSAVASVVAREEEPAGVEEVRRKGRLERTSRAGRGKGGVVERLGGLVGRAMRRKGLVGGGEV